MGRLVMRDRIAVDDTVHLVRMKNDGKLMVLSANYRRIFTDAVEGWLYEVDYSKNTTRCDIHDNQYTILESFEDKRLPDIAYIHSKYPEEFV